MRSLRLPFVCSLNALPSCVPYNVPSPQKKSGEEMAAFYADLCSKYPIISIEVRQLPGLLL